MCGESKVWRSLTRTKRQLLPIAPSTAPNEPYSRCVRSRFSASSTSASTTSAAGGGGLRAELELASISLAPCNETGPADFKHVTSAFRWP